MKRRDFLLSSLGLLGMAQFNGAFANGLLDSKSNLGKNKLIFILLRGGADGLSMLVPHGDKNYYKLRPTIAVPKNRVVKIDEQYGFHPGLKTSLLNFYENNELILIPNGGQKDNSRSHFQAQDVMEFGINEARYESGFLNRLVQVVSDAKPLSFTNTITHIFKGQERIGNLSLASLYTNIKNDEVELIRQRYKSNEDLLINFNNIVENNDVLAKIIEKDKSFATKTLLGKVGVYAREVGTNVMFVDFDGWDTHANQGTMSGTLNNLLYNLNKELKDLKENLKEEWKNTTVIMLSEFGRTIKENGSFGSDHGHGNLISIFGGKITKSKIIGKVASLELAKSHENRDLNALYDYREVLANILKHNIGISEQNINYIFPKINNEINEILT